MSLSILGGIGKGLSLAVPRGILIRPTSVLLKRRIFDYYQNLDDHLFVDGCAGSGAVGLEAWSRGASELYLIEKDRSVARTMMSNIKKVSERYSTEAINRPIYGIIADLLKWIPKFEKHYYRLPLAKQKQTILFLDPPYQHLDLCLSVLKRFDSNSYRGTIWLESDRQKGVEPSFWDDMGAKQDKIYRNGTSYIMVISF